MRLTEEQFWNSSAFLDTIYRGALARLVSPYAVLGYSLARMSSCIPPRVVLPAFVGSHGSLSILVAIVGPSGSGKGAAAGVANEVIQLPEVHRAPIGSGEGMAKAYGHREKQDGQWVTVMDHESVHFNADEADAMSAVSGRTGSTTTSFMRQGWAGERLGFSYSDETKAVILQPHTYRLTATISIQPKRSDGLLNESAGGTPQRFIWMPSTYGGLSADPQPMPEPYSPPTLGWDNSGSMTEIPFPKLVEAYVREERLKSSRGESDLDELDSHSTQTRLKVAALLAALDGSRKVRTTDWRLSGHVMEVSNAARAECVSALEDIESEKALQRGRQRIDERNAGLSHEYDLKNKRWATIQRKLGESRGLRRGKLNSSITQRLRLSPERFSLELKGYVDKQWLLFDEQDDRYFLGPEAPTLEEA